jgi:hypothetical protein
MFQKLNTRQGATGVLLMCMVYYSVPAEDNGWRQVLSVPLHKLKLTFCLVAAFILYLCQNLHWCCPIPLWLFIHDRWPDVCHSPICPNVSITSIPAC